ncbi:MAG TPA: hypothetical protein VF177_04560, partial [Anaerolineae bacterium]
RLESVLDFELMPYYPAIMGAVLLQLVPLFTGMVIGFLLLDQRDDRTLTALQITPLSLNGYLAYRLAVPTLLSVLLTLIVLPLAGFAGIGFLPLLLAAIVAALLAPLFALFLAAFAENKVQGFALMKAAGIILFPPLIAYFVPSGWQLAFGVMPTYWPARLYWLYLAGQHGFWIYLAAGIIYQSLLLAALVRRFNGVMTQ